MTGFELDAEKSKAVNRSASPTDCETCGGDRFVVYATRPVVASVWMRERGIVPAADATIDEVAGCPDCSTLDTSYVTGGRRTRPPDPAQVRERLRQ